MTTKTTKALIILDGWGQSDTSASNAIATANTPTWDSMLSKYSHTLIGTAGPDVGLPDGQMGNSEVGHMNIGAGRIVYQNFTRIGKAISDGDFFTNQVLVTAIDKAISKQGTVHICGLLSDGGVHSHQEHIVAACRMAKQRGADRIVVHAWLDGRDTPPRSAQPFLANIESALTAVNGRIGSISGRYFAMDRDQRWERTEQAYQAMRNGCAEYTYNNAQAALAAAYERGEDDEFVTPSVIVDRDGNATGINNGDSVICMNFRPDRARQITRALVETDFNGFDTGAPLQLAEYVMLTEYSAELGQLCACSFPPQNISNDLGEVVAKQGMQQLRIAETEKYAHVTFFFNGGQETPYTGETRELIASPNVATYDLQPEMSAPEVTDKLVSAIESRTYDLIVCNFANPDMVGHTGKFDAAVAAVEAVDNCLGRIIAALNKVGGEALVTADHGNVELMQNPITGQPHTAHTVWPVPLVYVSQAHQAHSLRQGVLADIAPTILAMMGLEQPAEMTGQSLLQVT
ncbi:MAG: 2,3-bisphosphoglycerate-independent phosphoglycerate mutase [Gammaproteobacteria bacterium]|jgi:2,3-bisphosphoglycerate-independent phosphoglycerate mutase|nr:2,3-bisphosphoglycerate-independent phosphoglycerate mutase [Gammaproteobacteria bacterium]